MAISAGYVVKETATNLQRNIFTTLGAVVTVAVSLSLLTLAGSLFWSLVGGVVYVTLKQRHHLTERELATTEG